MNKIIICACKHYKRIPNAAIREAVNAAVEAGIPCEVVPELCQLAAAHHVIPEGTVVYACQTRAIKAMFGQNTECVDLRSQDSILGKIQPAANNWIPWFPVIDQTRCVNCGKCVDFCMFGVYTKTDGKVSVTKPEGCKTDCPACARICPANAIIFPKSSEEQLNGSLEEALKPSPNDQTSFRERLEYRKKLRLFKED